MVKYLTDTFLIRDMKFTQIPHNRSVSGYGKKLPTHRMIQLFDHPRWYRMYVMCWSNAGTAYIVKDKEILVVRDCDV